MELQQLKHFREAAEREHVTRADYLLDGFLGLSSEHISLVRTYRDAIMVALRFDRIEEFVDSSCSACLENRRWNRSVEGSDCKPGQKRRTAVPHPASFRGRRQLCACSVGRRPPVGAYCTLRSVSSRIRKNRRALGRAVAHTSAGPVEKRKWTILGGDWAEIPIAHGK
jgi:hypothetical protein